MRISLRVLNTTSDSFSCETGIGRCDRCPIYTNNGGRCLGCSPTKLKECGQCKCDLGCNTCGGGPKVDVPAICCKSPTAKLMLSAATPNGNFVNPEYTFQSRGLIDAQARAIPIPHGGGWKITTGTPYLEENDVIGVRIKDVWSRKGNFNSRDLKDYLRVPASKKILLLTAQYDDWLELIWEKEFFGGADFEKHGIDYWMPAAYSMYIHDAHMNRYWQFLRTMYATMRGDAHFVVLPWSFNLKVDDLVLQALEKIPQAIVNAQFTGGTDKTLYKKILAGIVRWHNLVDKKVPFWFIGVGVPSLLHNLKQLCKGRKLYYFSTNPFRTASHGKRLWDTGKETKAPEMTREQLVIENQRAFLRMVEAHG